MPSSHFVFGFGSLVRASDLRKFLRRKADAPVTSRLCQLQGYRRCWNVAMDNKLNLPNYKYYIDPETGSRPEIYVTFLNIRPAVGHTINGILFSVTESELDMLDTREKNYERREVREAINTSVPGKVWVYEGTKAARERYEVGFTERKAYIQAAYFRYVHQCFLQLGQQHAQRYLDSTDAPEVPTLNLERVNLR